LRRVVVIQMLALTVALSRVPEREGRGPVRAFNADFLLTCY